MAMLSPEIEQFLESVASVSELEASDAGLVEAARALSGGAPYAADDVRQKLWFIRELRREIADAIARVRDQGALQILGGESRGPTSDGTRPLG
jgi:hypothetical protein